MNRYVPSRLALRVGWGSLMVVFAAYLPVACGLGGSDLLDVFSSWFFIALVLGAAALLGLRAFTGQGRRGPWLALAARAPPFAGGARGYAIAHSGAPPRARS